MKQDPPTATCRSTSSTSSQARIAACAAAGIEPARIALDPGIGFGKRDADNLAILRRSRLFHGLGCRCCWASRARGSAARSPSAPQERLPASLAAVLHALDLGVQLLRVHDVRAPL